MNWKDGGDMIRENTCITIVRAAWGSDGLESLRYWDRGSSRALMSYLPVLFCVCRGTAMG
jgi:hypothetical protein